MEKFKIALLSMSILIAAQSFGQKESKKTSSGGTTFSIGAETALPVGKDLKDGWSFGIGGSAKAAINIFDGGDVTLSAGYISFIGKTETITVLGQSTTFKNKALGTIPLKAGLRFKLGEGFYGEPQLGYTIAKVIGSSDNGNGFTYAGGIGYMASGVDLSVRYEAWTKSENGDTFSPSFIGLRVAYNFGK